MHDKECSSNYKPRGVQESCNPQEEIVFTQKAEALRERLSNLLLPKIVSQETILAKFQALSLLEQVEVGYQSYGRSYSKTHKLVLMCDCSPCLHIAPQRGRSIHCTIPFTEEIISQVVRELDENLPTGISPDEAHRFIESGDFTVFTSPLCLDANLPYSTRMQALDELSRYTSEPFGILTTFCKVNQHFIRQTVFQVCENSLRIYGPNYKDNTGNLASYFDEEFDLRNSYWKKEAKIFLGLAHYYRNDVIFFT